MANIELTAAEAIAGKVWVILKPFIVFIVIFVVGFAGAETWEHTTHPTIHLGPLRLAPFGSSLKTKLLAEEAKEPALVAQGQKAGIDQQTKADADAFRQWQDRVTMDETTIKTLRDQQAKALAEHDKFTTDQASEAFAMGRATCGATDAPSTLTGPSGQPAVDGVRQQPAKDFADLFEPGAYTAPGQVVLPAGSGR